MRDAHGGLGLVDVLAALAARAVGVDFQIFVLDVHIDVVLDFGDDIDRRERRVPALVGVEGADSDEPVDSALRLAIAVRVRADDPESYAGKPRLFAGLDVLDFGLVPAAFRPS